MTTIVTNWIPSQHSAPRHVAPELIVLHYSAGTGDEVSLGRYFQRETVLGADGRRRKLRASSHYGVGRPGGVAQYVSEMRTAWHAGDGKMPEDLEDPAGPIVPGVNPRSIGIEVCNRGWAPGKRPRVEGVRHRNPRSRSTSWEAFTGPQFDSTLQLCEEIRARRGIDLLTGHEDVTNYVTVGGSKTDPGPLWPWEVFTARGFRRMMFDFNTEEFVIV